MQLSTSTLFTTALALTAAVSPAVATIGRGVPKDLYKRHKAATLQKRQASPTNEVSAAQVSGAANECTAYSVPEVAALASQFPPIWENATILEGDTEAMSVWTAIKNSGLIPTSVEPKGTGE